MDAPTLREQLSRVPDAPGVYLWKDAGGEVLYVGKAKQLRSRMRSYLAARHPDRPAIEQMMGMVTGFDYVVTENEVESLILESNLIKQFAPPYNVAYRDDKTYPFIAVGTGDPYPAIKYTRERHRPGTRYFGPYTDARAARETIDVVRRIYPVCSAACVEWKRLAARGEPAGKACFDFHVGRGPGACTGEVDRGEYRAQVDKVVAFLSGRHAGVAEELEREMLDAAEALEFERAARFRNSLEAVKKVLERQKVVSARRLDADVFGIFREETIAGVHAFVVREGRVLIGNEFVLDKGLDIGEPELVEGFLLRYYGTTPEIPREVVVPALPEDPGAMEEWLSERRGTRVRLTVPRRGEKRRLLEMAATNARHTLARYVHRTRYDEERSNAALLQLESALALPAPPMRIECVDVSTLHGRQSVASLVVFEAGRPVPGAYRRFRIRMPSEEADDVAMMGEALRRRFARHGAGDRRFARGLPDLLIVDGGRPQLGAARAALADVGVAVPVAALAKREEELFAPGFDEPVVLPPGSASLYLVKRIRDEAHRFAVAYHRKLRGKAMTASALDDVPGVGPARKRALLQAFGSLKRLREASAAEIAQRARVPLEVAEDVRRAILSTSVERTADEPEGSQ